MSHRRRVVVWLLIGVATLIAFLSTLTLWVDRELLDNGGWTTASEKVIEDQQVQQALSVYLVNQLYSSIDVAAALQQRLPPNLDPIAAPAAVALREPAARAVSFMLARPRVQQLWIEASSRMHRRLVNVLENDTGAGISTGNGTVTLELGTLVARLATELGLSQKAIARIPPQSGTITLFKSSQLAAAQTAVRTVHSLSGWLLALVLALYGVAVYLAGGWRRVAVRSVGWALIGVGLAVLVTRKLVGNYVVDAISSPAYNGVGHRLWLVTTSVLGDLGWASVFYGVCLVGAALLGGEGRAAVAVRQHLAPIVNDSPGVTWGAAAFAWLVLALWGGTHALRVWWGLALAAGLLAAGVVALQRQIRTESRREIEHRPRTRREKPALV